MHRGGVARVLSGGAWGTGERFQRLRLAHAAYPLSPFIARFIAEAHFLARDFSGCVAVSRDALQFHPHCWLLYRALGRAMTALGEYGQARRYYRRASLLYDAPQIGYWRNLPISKAARRNKDRAGNILERLQLPADGQQVSFVSIALIHAALETKIGL